MISKQDILERATEWRLRPEIVEKDYVLGWLLAALGQHAATSEGWVFKGGTCLKKCFFETYRFSEDLDFSLLPAAAYDAPTLLAILTDVTSLAAELSGIEFPPAMIEVRSRVDKLDRPTFFAKLAYRGPLRMPNWPRLTFDVTAHEPLLAAVSVRPVHQPYADAPSPPATVRCYSLEELFAEKTRALFERTRPRDLYDVVYMSTNAGDAIDLVAARVLFRRKCTEKRREPPRAGELASIVRGSDEMRSEWANMLGHQLPDLVPLDAVLNRLDDAIAWVDDEAAAPIEVPASLPVAQGERIVERRGAWERGDGSGTLDAVRFAGANRLLVSFRYHAKDRLVEPYSLRRPATGNLLLYAWDTADGQIKTFKVGDIRGARATQREFRPRYRVELTTG